MDGQKGAGWSVPDRPATYPNRPLVPANCIRKPREFEGDTARAGTQLGDSV